MSESGLPIEPVYDERQLTNFRPEEKLGEPGAYPYTRGVYPTMYTKRPWTMRQYAGFASAAESSRRFQQLIEAGTTGLSVAAREIDAGERVVVGLNTFVSDGEEPYEPVPVDPAIETEQVARLDRVRARRDAAEFTRRISDLETTAEGTGNLLYPLREALRAEATLGEVCDAFRDVWGIYRPPDAY